MPPEPSPLEAGDIMLPPPQRPEQPVQRAAAPYVRSAIDAVWNSISGPSWAEQAGAQSQRDREAFARGGVREMMRDTEGTQELAGGFGGGGIAGITKGVAGAAPAFLRDVRPPNENLSTVLQSNFTHGKVVGDDVAPVSSLVGGPSVSDRGKTQALISQMKSPGGYWERPIVDDAGNVVEGAHRVEAARQMGVTDVPVYRVKDLERGLPTDQMEQAIKDVRKTHPDHVHQIMDQVVRMIDETGSAEKALQEFEFPPAFKDQFEAALKAAGTPAKGAAALQAGDIPEGALPTLTKGRAAAITATSLRNMPIAEAIKVAERGAHVIPKTGGGFVGAPQWVRTQQDLQDMRVWFDHQVEEGLAGAPWYGEAQAGIKETAGPDPARQHLQARELALFSAQSDPDVNLGFAIGAHNAWEMGQPLTKARTGAQARIYNRARASGEDIKLGKKTNIYAAHLDPTVEDPSTGTNDIWHARAFGYETPEGVPWDKALTAQQHAFMDAETVLAVKRANDRNLGGRNNWTPGEIQAAPWVAGKSKGLQRRRGMTKAEADAEAAKTYPAFYPKYTARGTYEATPGIGTGYLQNIATGPEALRAEYSRSPLSQWTDPHGRDVFYGALGADQRKTLPATGVFQTHEGPLEINEANVARPLAGLSGPTGQRQIDAASRQMLQAAEAARGYIDVQNMAASSMPIVGNLVSRSNSVFVPHNTRMTIEQISQLRAVGESIGLPHVIDYGEGIVLTDFGGQQNSKALTKVLKDSTFRKQLRDILPGEARRVELDVNKVDYENAFAAPQGSGAATRLLREHIGDEHVLNKLDASPTIRQKVLDRMQRDMEAAAQGGGIAREDVQRARSIIAAKGFRGLFAALDAGVALPAALLPIAVGAVAASSRSDE